MASKRKDPSRSYTRQTHGATLVSVLALAHELGGVDNKSVRARFVGVNTQRAGSLLSKLEQRGDLVKVAVGYHCSLWAPAGSPAALAVAISGPVPAVLAQREKRRRKGAPCVAPASPSAGLAKRLPLPATSAGQRVAPGPAAVPCGQPREQHLVGTAPSAVLPHSGPQPVLMRGGRLAPADGPYIRPSGLQHLQAHSRRGEQLVPYRAPLNQP